MAYFGLTNRGETPSYLRVGPLNQNPAGLPGGVPNQDRLRSVYNPADKAAYRDKFKTPRNPVAAEADMREMMPPPAYMSRATYDAFQSRMGQAPAYAVPAIANSYYAKERDNIERTVQDQFIYDFRQWLVDPGADGLLRTPKSTAPDVLTYLDLSIERKSQYMRSIARLKVDATYGMDDWPLEKLWIYYKFVVNGMDPTDAEVSEVINFGGVPPPPGAPRRGKAAAAQTAAHDGTNLSGPPRVAFVGEQQSPQGGARAAGDSTSVAQPSLLSQGAQPVAQRTATPPRPRPAAPLASPPAQPKMFGGAPVAVTPPTVPTSPETQALSPSPPPTQPASPAVPPASPAAAAEPDVSKLAEPTTAGGSDNAAAIVEHAELQAGAVGSMSEDELEQAETSIQNLMTRLPTDPADARVRNALLRFRDAADERKAILERQERQGQERRAKAFAAGAEAERELKESQARTAESIARGKEISAKLQAAASQARPPRPGKLKGD